MKILYIAGPYNGQDQLSIESNIQRARDVQIDLANIGIPAFCPHSHSANYHLRESGCTADEPFWISFYLEMVKRCDGLFALTGWDKSKGSTAEIQLAIRKSKKIFLQGTHTFREIRQWAVS